MFLINECSALCRLSVGESHSKPMLSERMKMFEEFIALFDVD